MQFDCTRERVAGGHGVSEEGSEGAACDHSE